MAFVVSVFSCSNCFQVMRMQHSYWPEFVSHLVGKRSMFVNPALLLSSKSAKSTGPTNGLIDLPSSFSFLPAHEWTQSRTA